MLFRSDDGGGVPGAIIAQTAWYTIVAGDIFTGFVTLQFAAPVALAPGDYYAAIRTDDNITIIMKDQPPIVDLWINDISNGGDGTGWYFAPYVAFIRLNLQYTPDNDDLALNTVEYYSSIPEGQIVPIAFAGRVANNGANAQTNVVLSRSEERRVGKECRSRLSPYP